MPGWIALAIGIIGAGAQAEEQRRATSQQKKADEIDQRKTQIQNARERRKAVAEARKRRAEIVAGAEASGTGGSSGAAGATGALTAKTAGTVGFQQSMEAMDSARFRTLQKATDSMTRANIHGAASQIGFASIAPMQSISESAGLAPGSSQLDTTTKPDGSK